MMELEKDKKRLQNRRVLLPSLYKGPKRVAFFGEVTHRIESLPGVRSANAISFMPFGGLRPSTGFVIETHPKPRPGEAPLTQVRVIRPNYFRTMGIPLFRHFGMLP
jgi:hypothetical protein